MVKDEVVVSGESKDGTGRFRYTGVTWSKVLHSEDHHHTLQYIGLPYITVTSY